MADVEELKDALKDSLEHTGKLRELKAKLRADIYHTLASEVQPRPAPSNENLLINELIREYLIFNGYRETLSVMIPETGQPQAQCFERSMLAEHLHIVEGQHGKQLPLLYSLVKSAQLQHGAGKQQA